MKQIVATGILLLTLFFTLTFSHAASIPPLINYQGMLTDAQGAPIANGTQKLTFNIYDAANGGNLIWGPQVFDPVPVINGMFNIILGTTDSGGRSIVDAFGAEARFLGITVDTVGQTAGTAITPRQQILSTPYAMQAGKANHHSNILPVGMIAPFLGTVAPEGWLICDGAEIGADPEYDALKAFLSSTTLPDLRGVFLRGLDTRSEANGGRDVDGALSGRTLGSYQADQFKIHDHQSHGHGSTIGGSSSGPYPFAWVAGTPNTGQTGGSETRSKNITVNYIIKY
ncbi:MAG: phage tail protein [Pseudomonadota bacterium]